MTRSYTPPHLKWLLNERAALMGEADTLQARIDRLQSQAAMLEQRRHESLAKAEALTRAIQRAESRVRPDALGAIRAWAGKYGKRGDLKTYLVETIGQAGATGITTDELIRHTVDHFDLVFDSKEAFKRWARSTLRTRLLRLSSAGVVERRKSGPEFHDPFVWRLASGPSSLAALAALAAVSDQ